MKKLNILFAILIAVLGVTTLKAQTDVTSLYLTNADFASVDGWNIQVDKVGESYGGTYYKLDTGTDPNTIEVYHTWAGSSAPLGQTKNFKFSQTVNLPAGEYRLKVNGFYREGNQQNATTEKAWAFAGDKKQHLVGIGTCGANNMGDAANVFRNGGCLNEFDFTVTEAGEVELGFQGYINTSLSWVILGPVTLWQYNMDDFNAELNTARTKLSGITGLNTVMQNRVNNVLAETENVTQTKEAILEATARVNAMYDEAVALLVPLAKFDALLTLCEKYASEDYSNVETDDVRNVFNAAITTARGEKDSAETIGDLETAFANLETARKEYVLKAIPTTGNSFDMTFLMSNAQVTSATNWSNGGTASGQQYTGAPDNTYLDWCNWSGKAATIDMYNTITGLPSGVYTLTAATRANADISEGYIYGRTTSNIYKSDIHKVGNSGNVLGNGWGWTVVEDIEIVDGNLTVGFYFAAPANGIWAGADNFTLERAFNSELLKNSVSQLFEEAEVLSNKKMNASVKSVLQEAIAGTDVNSTNPFRLNEMDAALKSAIADANASVADYEKLQKYINMTKDFTDVAAYESKYNNGEYTTNDVERVRQELNVLRYNATSTIFLNKVEVTGWTGALKDGEIGGQHWDGTSTTKYYDANSWTSNYVGLVHTLSTELTLPAGSYVLKAAGRSSADATLSLSVKADENQLGYVEYTGKGDTGKGIDTDGKANFSEEGTYAHGNQGRGWEWEFAKFELDKETTVTLNVKCDYNSIQNRFGSFSDITLWMDDEAYVNYYGDAINAPLAEAQALVNTKPMGEAENAALVSAIALGEGTIETPAQLNAAIEALNTAVANAKTWIAAYNEAKAPLVAAFERFEADYNDGANGPARAMTTDMWTTLLEAVKVAAVAKDVTDSYDGFAKAAEDFNAAMDAIDNAYAAEGLLQDMTHLIGNADCKANEAWPGSGRSTLTGEHWSGDANRVYFAQNHENGAARTQTVTLPKTGTYYLKVAVRAVEAGSYVDIIINGKSNKTTGAHGRVGGTIATDGTEWESVEAGLKEGKTFANDNKGYGWVYKHIYFEAEEGDATIALNLSNANSSREANVGGMELYYVTIGDELLLDENSTSFGGVEGWYKSVTVNRTIKTGVWNTFVVPFDMEIPEGWEVMDLAETEMNGDVITMKFGPAESIEAGVPYMVRVAEQVYSIEVEEVFVYEGMVGSATDHIAFNGVYSKDYVPAGSFFISNNTFYRAADGSNTLKAFRAYLIPGNANVKSVGYTFGDDDFTAIEGVEDAESEVVAIYGADGALRTGLQKGLNIVKLSNGKVQKVLVK